MFFYLNGSTLDVEVGTICHRKLHQDVEQIKSVFMLNLISMDAEPALTCKCMAKFGTFGNPKANTINSFGNTVI